MKSVTSLSGGKTSAYMAVHYPTDIYIFALVLIDHPPSMPKDKGLVREIQQRIPWFIATAEADQTLTNLLRLEQKLGREIKWVSAENPLDDYILGKTDIPGYRSGKALLPNKAHRFCTVEQKIKPIFNYLFTELDEPFLMNIGYRWDEPQRVKNYTCDNDKMRYPYACSLKSGRWQYREVEWRVADFPLYRDRVTSDIVKAYWDKEGWFFPAVSNCRYCFHHRPIQQQYQYQIAGENANAEWWIEMERRVGKTFADRPLLDTLQQPLLDVYSGSGEGRTENTGCFCGD